MGPFAYLQDRIHNLVERAGGRKNLMFIAIGILVAGVVAVGWGLSEWETSYGVIVVGHLL